MEYFSNLIFILSLVSITIYSAFYIISIKGIKNSFANNYKPFNIEYVYLFALIAIISVTFNLNQDVYKLYNWFYYEHSNDFWPTDSHFEPIYFVIRRLIPNSYYLFRLVVWGFGVYLFRKICIYTNINTLLAVCLFVVFYIHTYAYARASVGVMTCTFTYILFLQRKTKSVNFYFLCVMLFVLSALLHKSMLVLISLIIISYFVPCNRITVFILILLFYPLTLVLQTSLVQYIVQSSDFFSISTRTLDEYLFQNSIERDEWYVPHIPALIIYLYSLIMYFWKGDYSNILIRNSVMASIIIFYFASLINNSSIGNLQTASIKFYLMTYIFGLVVCTYIIIKYKPKKIWLYGLFTYTFFGFFYQFLSILKRGGGIYLDILLNQE